MQRHSNRYYSCLYLSVSLFLSISVYLLLMIVSSHRWPRSVPFAPKTSSESDLVNRLVIFVRSSHHCQARLTYLLRSWIPLDGTKQRNLYLITDRRSKYLDRTALNFFQHVIETDCPETHNRYDLCCKTAHEFDLFFRLITTKPNLQWMCRFDDDQYVNLENLYTYLSHLNSSQPFYIGRTSAHGLLRVANDPRTYRFATYGAGVCFSRALLDRLRLLVNLTSIPHDCVKRGLSDDAYIGYLAEIVLNVSLTADQELFHSHLEKLDQSFRRFTLEDLNRMITLGFAWDRYQLEWLPVIHQLVQLLRQDQYGMANELWSFLRAFEETHPENLREKYDQSCLSYHKKRNQSLELAKQKNNATVIRAGWVLDSSEAFRVDVNLAVLFSLCLAARPNRRVDE